MWTWEHKSFHKLYATVWNIKKQRKKSGGGKTKTHKHLATYKIIHTTPFDCLIEMKTKYFHSNQVIKQSAIKLQSAKASCSGTPACVCLHLFLVSPLVTFVIQSYRTRSSKAAQLRIIYLLEKYQVRCKKCIIVTDTTKSSSFCKKQLFRSYSLVLRANTYFNAAQILSLFSDF